MVPNDWTGRRINGIFTLLIVVIVMSSSPFLDVGRDWWVDLYVVLVVVWIWIPAREKTFLHAVTVTGILAVGLLAVAVSGGGRMAAASMLWPLGGVLGGRGHKAPWSQAALVSVAIIELVLRIPYGLATSAGDLLSLFGLYWGFRAVEVRRAAQALDRQRVAELEAAYDALQDAHEKLIETAHEASEARARQTRLETLADIHDGVGHRLTSLIIGLESLEMMIAEDPATASDRVSELVETARWALQDVRQAVRDRGDNPRAEDLDALIAGVRERAPLFIEVNWAVAPEGLPAPLRGTIFNVLQEALTNILRHAQAHHVRIHLAEESNQLRFEVADDGILQAVGVPGFGLTQMRQRCQALGGALQLTAKVPHGLLLSVTLPYVNKEDNSHADTHFSGR